MENKATNACCRSREHLINSAVALASTPNFFELSLDDIAQAYGIPTTEAHMCFATKDELLAAVRAFLTNIFDSAVTFPTAPDFAGAIRELTLAYTRCSRSNGQLYRAMYSLMPATTALAQDDPHPLVAMVARVVDKFAPEADEWLRRTRIIAIFSAIHGLTYLCTFGSLRHLGTPAKDYLAIAVANHAIAGIGDSLETGRALSVAPHDFQDFVGIKPIPAATDFPRETADEKRAALFRGAIEVIAYHGPDALTLEAAAARSGISLADARAILDPELGISEQLENYLDDWSLAISQHYMEAAGDQASITTLGKLHAFSYAAIALADPLGCAAYLTVSSTSVVPNSFEDGSGYFEQGKSFHLLVDLTSRSLTEGGVEPTPWLLFENSLVTWSYAHGLAHGLSKGPLRTLPQAEKFELLSPVFDISLAGLKRRLDLNLPDFEELPVTRPGR